jgi:hypothetical protein
VPSPQKIKIGVFSNPKNTVSPRRVRRTRRTRRTREGEEGEEDKEDKEGEEGEEDLPSFRTAAMRDFAASDFS